MSRPFTIVSILFFLVIAAVQLAWLLMGLPTIVNGVAVPQWVSIAIMVVALAAMFGLWRELFLGSDDDEVATRSRGMKPPPVWQVNGQRLPADYFMFASRGVTAKSIRGAADKYDRIMVGFDQGNIPDAALAAAKQVGAELEIYIEGPGGVTGTAWSSDEKARVKRASAKVGIDTSKTDWMHEWDKWGWKTYAFLQLEEFKGQGYSAAEIDNLGRVLGESNEPLIAFYKEYAERCLAGHIPRLIMKNNSEAQCKAVTAAIASGELPRAMFSEFHICEKGTGYNRKKLDAITAEAAIRTIPSNDTYNYDAYGEFGLGYQFAKLMPAPAAPAPAAPAAPASPPEAQAPTQPPAPSPANTPVA